VYVTTLNPALALTLTVDVIEPLVLVDVEPCPACHCQATKVPANLFVSVPVPREKPFELNYAPAIDKTKIKILKNNQLVLNNEYSVVLFKSTVDEYSLLKGKIIFNVVPQGPDVATGYAGDQIFISYEKNDQLLDGVNRIQKYYTHSS
jgi:hypothetical protein